MELICKTFKGFFAVVKVQFTLLEICVLVGSNRVDIYLFKVNIENSKALCEICSQLKLA